MDTDLAQVIVITVIVLGAVLGIPFLFRGQKDSEPENTKEPKEPVTPQLPEDNPHDSAEPPRPLIAELAEKKKLNEQNNPSGKNNGLLFVIILLIIIAGFLAYEFHFKEVISEPSKEYTPNQQLVHNWLTDLKSGGDGMSYWDSSPRATKLYAVRDWEILKEKTKTFGGDGVSHVVSVRIDSSTKGGIRITKIWDVEIFAGKLWEINEN